MKLTPDERQRLKLSVDIRGLAGAYSVVVPGHLLDQLLKQLEQTERDADLLRKALTHAYESLRFVIQHDVCGHDGDSETGEHFEDCSKCVVDEAMAHAEDVFERTSQE